MSRIEDALAKLRSRETSREGKPLPRLGRVVSSNGSESAQVSSEARPVSSVGAGVRPVHPYRGKPLEIDLDRLHALRMLAPDSEERRLADEYRMIKRPLLKNAAADRDPKLPGGNLLMVASALPGEGKTFTSINLCLSLAREEDWSVVLVDADCAKRHLTTMFGAENEPGLVDVLSDPDISFESCVMPTNVRNLSVLPSGKSANNVSELMSSDRMTRLCETLATSDTQRIVVFDSSPLLLTAEAAVLSMQVGQVLIVVHANRTPQQAVLRAKSLVDESKAIGLLLNQADAGDSLGYYADYYRYGG